MSKISKDGYEQIQVIKNALESMFDKLDTTVYTKVKPTKNEDVNYKSTNVFDSVKTEFEAIAGIVNESGNWEEV
jgi:Flp pilus assembly pilin Flp